MTTLDSALVEILQQATAGIKTGISFLSAQLPDVIRQLLLYHLIYDCVAVLSILVGFGIYAYAIYRLWKWVIKQEKDNYSVDYYYFPCGMVSGMSALFVLGGGLPLLWANLMEALQLWIAPKIWLIEYAASLIKH